MSDYLIVAIVFTVVVLALANLSTYAMTKNEKLTGKSKKVMNTDIQYLSLKSDARVIITSKSPFTMISDQGAQFEADLVQNREPWENPCYIINRVFPAGNWKRLSKWLEIVQFLSLYSPENVDGYLVRKDKIQLYILGNFVVSMFCGMLIYLMLTAK